MTSQRPTLSQYSLRLVGLGYSTYVVVLERLVMPRTMAIGAIRSLTYFHNAEDTHILIDSP